MCNLISAIGNSVTMVSGNTLNSTLSLIVAVIELLSCGHFEKNVRLFTNILVTSIRN